MSCQPLDDRSEQQRRKEGEGADEHDHADEQDGEGGVVRPQRAEPGGADALAGEGAGDGEREDASAVAKGVLDAHPAVVLSVAEVFGEHDLAAEPASRLDDRRVPVGDLKAGLRVERGDRR